MTPAEAQLLLGIAASFDNRRPSEEAAIAWSHALGDIPFVDCRDAIVNHYRSSSEWLMPAKVIAGVKRIRDQRVSDYGPIPDPNHLDTTIETFDRDYRAYLADTTRAIADGHLAPGELPAGLTALETSPRRDVIAELGQIGRSVPHA